MKKVSGNTPPRSIRVPAAEWEKWTKIAAKRGISLTQLIRQRMNALR